MKFIIILFGLACVAHVYGDCPRKSELHCHFYDAKNCPPGTSARNTFIIVNGKRCDACRVCFTDSAVYGCPPENCPYKNIRETYPMDCGIQLYKQKTFKDGRECDACATFTKDCSDMSWLGK